MSKEKQIEEMAIILLKLDDCEKYDEIKCIEDCKKCRATQIYNAGYRKQEWISVDERLPEADSPVLIFTRKNRYYVGYYYKAAVDRNYTGFYADSCKRDVTHWMPLPEPPMMKGGAE